MPAPYISPAHETILASSAITLDDARAWGIKTVAAPTDLHGTDLDTHANAERTGLLFPLRMGDETITYQMRLDKPEGDRKYVQAWGTGSIINVPEQTREKLSSGVGHILIVEGTKQTIAATLYAPDDVAVIGVQGCRNWSSGGVPVPDMSTILQGATRVTIALDADRKVNPDVWTASEKLAATATAFGATTVDLIDLPSGGKSGLDDFLGSVPDPAQRQAVLRNLIAGATTRLGRKPAAKVRHKAADIPADSVAHLDRGVISKLVRSPEGVEREEIILGAAARIVASEAHIDEETQETSSQRLTLEVVVATEEGEIVKHPVKVASRDLASVGEWIDRLPHGLGVGIRRKTKPDDDVANAIRAVSQDFKSITVVPRTGWTFDAQDEVYRWCDGEGAIGADDKIDRLRGEPASRDFQAISLPADGVSRSSRKGVASARDMILARDLFRTGRELSWDVAVAAWGLAFIGITPNAALCYFGPPSSGKSTIAQAIASSLSESWAPRSGSAMATFNARPAGMDLLPNGLSHCLLHVDDLRPEADKRNMEAALRAFDALLRRAHGSGGAVRGEVNRASDSLGVRKVDSSAPMMLITGEQIPSGDGFADSGLDRALIISIKPDTLFDQDKLGQFEHLAKSGSHRRATASYISWLAEKINSTTATTPDGAIEEIPARERFEAWRAQREEERQGYYTGDGRNAIFDADQKVSSRAQMLAASLVLGYFTVMQWAVEIGALSHDEARDLILEFRPALQRAILSHTSEIMGGNASEAENALAALRNAVSARDVSIEPRDSENHKPIIGDTIVLPGGERVVAINHSAAARALRWPGGPRALQRALAEVSLKDSKGKHTRTLTINNVRVQCVAVPESKWNESDEPGEQGQGLPGEESF